MAAYQGKQDYRLAFRPMYSQYFNCLIFGEPFVAQYFRVVPVLSENSVALGLCDFHQTSSAVNGHNFK